MPGSSPAAWQRTAGAFTAAVESGRLDLPLPGSGATWERWAAFADLAGEDLSLARLGEGHADAVAILAELGGPRPRTGSRWGVWAANPPGPNVSAGPHRGRWRAARHQAVLLGGAGLHEALVTAAADDGPRLFAVAVGSLSPGRTAGPPPGWRAATRWTSAFRTVPGGTDRAAGRVREQARVQPRRRRGGGLLVRRGTRRRPHAAQRRGQTRHRPARAGAPGGRRPRAAARRGPRCSQAAHEIDADPGDRRGEGALRALRVRTLTEAVATDVLARTGRALGAGPLSHDEAHSRAVADLTVYLRQHHAERTWRCLASWWPSREPRGEPAPPRPQHPIDAPGTDEASGAPGRDSTRCPQAGTGQLAGQRRDRGRAPGRRGTRRRRPDIGAGRGGRTAAAGGGHRRRRLAPGPRRPGRARTAPDGGDDRRAARPGRRERPRWSGSGCPTPGWPASEDELAAALAPLTAGFDMCLAPWDRDLHPDHEAAGRAARRAAPRVLCYPVWMWHWASPADPRVPWDRALRVPLPPRAAARSARRSAASPARPRTGATASGPVLAPAMIAHFTRDDGGLLP